MTSFKGIMIGKQAFFFARAFGLGPQSTGGSPQPHFQGYTPTNSIVPVCRGLWDSEMFLLANLIVAVLAVVGVVLAIGTRDRIRTIEFRLRLIERRLSESPPAAAALELSAEATPPPPPEPAPPAVSEVAPVE